MNLAFQIGCVCCLGWIAYQDFKDREVFLLLFIVLTALLGMIHYQASSIPLLFLSQVGINLSLLTLVVLLIYGYSRWIAKQSFLNHSIGMGDILLFIAMAIGFPVISFLLLFCFSLVFSLIVYTLFRNRFQANTIPLAGLMSLFLIGCLLGSLIFKSPLLYAL